ncbi:hydroxymethylglutaryl-CoA lyase [Marinibactrum halimedae]|uniref:Hydroxymethylglutaryl-CoA lyase n=1 Tax=Marinibactrum halimedae TaxID=1444977 RepID=A0AA37T897_9GAMM|nr:hydroxymethylglutaryl-CoA lyase [Marinibactrum halimedae]MCD9458126.1 hydroxymethylglutaryl-CoA lyase [Marinibactrum halimedae]GLS25060.1 hydroxymethylglutaryl-CoA lyase [Marinibactrum halimedae]
MFDHMPESVEIVEVGPRDGLQNEQTCLSPSERAQFIRKLTDTGLTHIEAGSFVNPKRVPQLANSNEVFSQLDKSHTHVVYSALVPNEKGLQAAIESGCKTIAIFTGASETFCKKNINASIKESFDRFTPVITEAKVQNISVRGYLSCIAGCPFEGEVSPHKVIDLTWQLLEAGCYQVSLGDTIGTASPKQIQSILIALTEPIRQGKIAVHFHDTYGQAITNIFAALQLGVQVIDSSVAGLGGCPFAAARLQSLASQNDNQNNVCQNNNSKKSSGQNKVSLSPGNVATEDVLYLLEGLGIHTGVNRDHVIDVGHWVCQKLQRPNQAKSVI